MTLLPFVNPRLNHHQFGFRPKHTSLDLLTNTTQRWLEALAARFEVRICALDVGKAFDRVWHEGIIHKLERIGVTGTLLNWFRSYLSNRRQRVSIGSAFSDFKVNEAGVPQGSVLGPILFIIFFNDLFDVVDSSLDVFADDSQLWRICETSNPDDPMLAQKKRQETADALNKDLDAIDRWAKRWLVTFNHTKTELVTISRRDDVVAFRKSVGSKKNLFKPSSQSSLSVSNPHPPISFCNAEIPESVSAKVVGLTFTANLSWKAHVRKVVTSAKRSLYFIRRIAPYIHPSAICSLYKSHIRSTMEYLSPIWNTAPDAYTELCQLDRIQEKLKDQYLANEPTATNLQPLAHRRGVSGLCFIHRLINNSSSPAIRDLAPALAPPPRRSSRSKPKYLVEVQHYDKKSKAEYYKHSCIPAHTRAFNQLVPTEVQSLRNLQQFKKKANQIEGLDFLHPSHPKSLRYGQ